MSLLAPTSEHYGGSQQEQLAGDPAGRRQQTQENGSDEGEESVRR